MMGDPEETPTPAGVPGRAAAMAAAVGLLAAFACARMSNPPGGPPDRIPPQVVATTPDTFATVDGPYDDAVVFRFNERISERPTEGELSDAVIVSPRTGQVQVEHSRQSLEVSLIGGFRDSLVYRLTLRPVIRDMFQNTMLEAFELVFSTGPPIEPYVLAGTVVDRITGERIAGARVNAVHRDPGPDTLVHTAVTDTGGVYAMRYVPQGVYTLTAFEDMNRNAELDPIEARGEHPGILDPPADTSIATIELLAPDTTPARVVSVEVADSASLVVETDDHLDAASPYLQAATVELAPAEDAEPGAPVPEVDSLFHAHEWRRRAAVVDSIRAERADSLETVADSLVEAGDSVAADSARARARRIAPGPGGGAAGDEGGAAPPRSEQTFYALLDGPLPVNVPYRVTVEGIENINGVSGGGGDAAVVRSPPPDTAAADSADASEAPPDSTEATPDTTTAPDTSAVEPDTTGARPDRPRRHPKRETERSTEAPGARS